MQEAEIEKTLERDLKRKQRSMIISVVLFTIAVIGASYAWLMARIEGVPNELAMTSAGLSLSYRGLSPAILADMAPGETVLKTFEISNFTDVDQKVNLYWKNATNTFLDQNYFMYFITNLDTNEVIVSPRYLPPGDVTVIYDMVIPAATTYNYSLTITYANDPIYNQIRNANEFFTAYLSINTTDYEMEKTLNVYVNGEYGEGVPTLSDYYVDNYRTYCTDGADILISAGSLEITNKTNTTTCDLYLVSNGNEIDTTNFPKYNLLVMDTGGGVLEADYTGYYFYDDKISLSTPEERSGYAYLGWEATGRLSSIDNDTLTMGRTYTYLKAGWVEGHWVKTIQTCTQGAPETYTRTYTTCERNALLNYTKTSKTCVHTGTTYTRTYKHCHCDTRLKSPGVLEYYNCRFLNMSSTVASCAIQSSFNCAGWSAGSGYTTSCTVLSQTYNFDTATTTTASTCAENIIACGSSTSGQSYVTCVPNYSYRIGVTNYTNVTSTCSVSAQSSCTQTDYNNQTQYTKACAPRTYGAGYVASETNSGICKTESEPTCTSGTLGRNYVSDCTLVRN